MLKEHLLQDVVEAFEQVIAAATQAAQRGATRQEERWGPREIVAHLTGWEVMASVRISQVAAGMPPFEFNETAQIDDAINMAFVTMIGDQSLATVCNLLRQAYQRNSEMLRKLDDTCFQPGEYVYERTKAVIEHCQEHREVLVATPL